MMSIFANNINKQILITQHHTEPNSDVLAYNILLISAVIMNTYLKISFIFFDRKKKLYVKYEKYNKIYTINS